MHRIHMPTCGWRQPAAEQPSRFWRKLLTLAQFSADRPKQTLLSRVLLGLALAFSGPLAAHATVPSPPTAVWTYLSGSNIIVGWNVSSGATSYNIYRGTTSGGEGATAYGTLSGGSSNRYTDTGVTSGTTYYYKVTAVNASG